MRIALVCPHMFMNSEIMPGVIFSPGFLALDLAEGLKQLGHEVTLFSPGKVDTSVKNLTSDLSLFNHELSLRGYGFNELLKKHPLLFINLARQVQGELISKAYKMANEGEFDVVHVYMNEEEIAMQFANFCKVPLVFTHHEPFNYLAKYRTSFPKYKDLNWISISYSQRKSMPSDTNWVGNVYHGIKKLKVKSSKYKVSNSQTEGGNYIAFLGRIIEPKGVHLAIKAIKKYNRLNAHSSKPLSLKIAGKHYSDVSKDKYWSEIIQPQIDNKEIQYVGFINDEEKKREFLRNARALIAPSTWEEPFGMMMIEALREGTPILGLNNGAIGEIIKNGINGILITSRDVALQRLSNTTKQSSIENDMKGPEVNAKYEHDKYVDELSKGIEKVLKIPKENCRRDFEERFTVERMCRNYEETYLRVISSKL